MVEIIETNSQSVLDLMWKCLQDISAQVKITASRTICLILAAVTENENFRQVFNVVLDVIQGMQANDLGPVLAAIPEVIESSPGIVAGSIEKLVSIMANIGKISSNSFEVRGGAIEILNTSIRKLRGLVLQSQFFIQESLTLSMILLSEIDNPLDLQQWNLTIESEVHSSEPFGLGKELLCTISDILLDPVYPHAIMLIEAHLNAPHWLHQHTGIIALGMISEGCRESMIGNLEHFITTLCAMSYSENPRLKWAALTSLGLFSTYFAPNLQQKYYDVVLRSIISNLGVGTLPKVMVQALRCSINFCNGLESEEETKILLGYTPTLVQAYLGIFTSSNTGLALLQELLSSLSVLCLSVPDFNQYSSLFLSKLRTIYAEHVQFPDDLKCAAIRCIGCIVESTSCEETEAIFTEMIQLKGKTMDSSMCYTTILDVIVNCIAVLKERAISYCSILVHELLKNANNSIDFIVVDGDTPAADMIKGINIPLRGLGSKKVAISTSALENKISACKLIHGLVKSLGRLYGPWVMDTLSVISPLVNFSMNADVRKFSYKIITALPKICTTAQADTLVISCFPYLTTLIAEKNTTFPEDVKKITATMNSISMQIGSLAALGLTGAIEISKILAECIREVYNRRETRTNAMRSIASMIVCAEEMEIMKEAEEVDEQILRNSIDIVGFLLKSFKTQFQGCFTTYFRGLVGELFYKPDASDSQLISSCCLFCDYIEHTGDLLENNLASPLLEVFIKLCYHKNCDIRQCAVFGIGLAAMHGNRNIFSKYADTCANACKHILGLSEAMSEEFLTCTECAAGTIGKIAVGYNRDDLVRTWLEFLPLKSDPEEAVISHQIFLEHFDQIKSNPAAVNVLNALRNTEKEYLSQQSISILRSIY